MTAVTANLRVILARHTVIKPGSTIKSGSNKYLMRHIRGNEVGNDWHAYVNQKPRQAWFNVSQETSDDGESVYYRSKYALTQQSIQTYYNLDDTDISTALGIEHTNETFGMNMRWTSAVGSDGLDPDNGRYNVWLKAGGRNGGSTAGRWNEYGTYHFNSGASMIPFPFSSRLRFMHANIDSTY